MLNPQAATEHCGKKERLEIQKAAGYHSKLISLCFSLGVERLTTLIDGYYNDNATAYILTSDHGMTEWGLLFRVSDTSHELIYRKLSLWFT